MDVPFEERDPEQTEEENDLQLEMELEDGRTGVSSQWLSTLRSVWERALAYLTGAPLFAFTALPTTDEVLIGPHFEIGESLNRKRRVH